MRIIKTYEDSGKSGLNIRGRPALQRLLHDVEAEAVPFRAVLVYDISRWGRFPDPDEAAVYEQTCKRRGVKIIYCAEPFANDGSLSSTVMVSIKRSMAAEYSRELSVKVFAGHRTLVQHGYRQGGVAGYGLRRQLLDESNNPKAILKRGEHKSLQTDRVMLIPGPDDELAVVKRIYDLFLDEQLREHSIAELLNQEGVAWEDNKLWSSSVVREILTNEKYIGNNVYNRASFKLKIERRANAPSDWIRRDGAYKAIVPADRFRQVQALIAERSVQLSDEQMLALLRSTYEEHGDLSGVIIDESESLPSSAAYGSRFGGLLRAYRLVGFYPRRDYAYLEINRMLRALYPEVVASVSKGITSTGGTTATNSHTQLLLVNGELSLSIVIARCKTLLSGLRRWNVRFDSSLQPDLTVVVRMGHDNKEIRDYYVLPSIDSSAYLTAIREENGFQLEAYRVASLDSLYQFVGRSHLREAA